MIRLAISCDICGAEKKQTNHWFVAWEQNGELRIGGWASRFCKRADARHLCGQTCLHKLVDEFMAKTIAEGRAASEPGIVAEQPVADSSTAAPAIAEDKAVAACHAGMDTSLTLPASHAPHSHLQSCEDEFGSSARLITTPEPEAAPRYVSHPWRAGAWERERERGLRGESGTRRHKL